MEYVCRIWTMKTYSQWALRAFPQLIISNIMKNLYPKRIINARLTQSDSFVIEVTLGKLPTRIEVHKIEIKGSACLIYNKTSCAMLLLFAEKKSSEELEGLFSYSKRRKNPAVPTTPAMAVAPAMLRSQVTPEKMAKYRPVIITNIKRSIAEMESRIYMTRIVPSSHQQNELANKPLPPRPRFTEPPPRTVRWKDLSLEDPDSVYQSRQPSPKAGRTGHLTEEAARQLTNELMVEYRLLDIEPRRPPSSESISGEGYWAITDPGVDWAD